MSKMGSYDPGHLTQGMAKKRVESEIGNLTPKY